MSLNDQIQSIVVRAASDITAVVRQTLAAEINRILVTDGEIKGKVAAAPGKRSEEIQKSVGIGPALAKKALVKLRENGKVKMKGVKRAATYAAA